MTTRNTGYAAGNMNFNELATLIGLERLMVNTILKTTNPV
jgi:hypothetical protein